MTGILNALIGSGGVITNTFNLTAATIPSGGGAGYNDGSAGTVGSAAGSLSPASIGRATIAEVGSFSGAPNQDIIWIKGFTSDPGINWLVSITINSASHTGSSATYTYDATHGIGKWAWTDTWGVVTGNTYNGNTIKHQP